MLFVRLPIGNRAHTVVRAIVYRKSSEQWCSSASLLEIEPTVSLGRLLETRRTALFALYVEPEETNVIHKNEKGYVAILRYG
jgi:hypothetical protein